ncbi:hypothetical protein FRC03_001964 [Tulasnella sp. 419]|nr:hypothetical protein FRC03_001964 [Tulasnella sp. 419]
MAVSVPNTSTPSTSTTSRGFRSPSPTRVVAHHRHLDDTQVAGTQYHRDCVLSRIRSRQHRPLLLLPRCFNNKPRSSHRFQQVCTVRIGPQLRHPHGLHSNHPPMHPTFHILSQPRLPTEVGYSNTSGVGSPLSSLPSTFLPRLNTGFPPPTLAYPSFHISSHFMFSI